MLFRLPVMPVFPCFGESGSQLYSTTFFRFVNFPALLSGSLRRPGHAVLYILLLPLPARRGRAWLMPQGRLFLGFCLRTASV